MNIQSQVENSKDQTQKQWTFSYNQKNTSLLPKKETTKCTCVFVRGTRYRERERGSDSTWNVVKEEDGKQ